LAHEAAKAKRDFLGEAENATMSLARGVKFRMIAKERSNV
jgi:hypothetical protein